MEVVSGITSGTEKINDNKSGEYEKDYMRIKFDSDDKLPLNKQLKFLSVTIVIRSVLKMMVNIILKLFWMIVCMNYKILEYDRIDISEDIDMNKRRASKECEICHYWYFLDKNFSHEPYPCNGCDDVAIVSIRENDYRIHFCYMSKDEAISIMHNSNLNEKTGLL